MHKISCCMYVQFFRLPNKYIIPISIAKCQLTSKCLFDVLILPKNKRKQFDLRYYSNKVKFLRQASCKARLLVITSVSDLYLLLGIFVFFSPFSYLLTYIVNADVISDFIFPKWIKLDQTWSKWISHQSKNATIKSCLIYRKGKNDFFVFDFYE